MLPGWRMAGAVSRQNSKIDHPSQEIGTEESDQPNLES
jgi:hypothetical protein